MRRKARNDGSLAGVSTEAPNSQRVIWHPPLTKLRPLAIDFIRCKYRAPGSGLGIFNRLPALESTHRNCHRWIHVNPHGEDSTCLCLHHRAMYSYTPLHANTC